MKFKTRAKKWGSSLAIVLPKSVVEVKKRHFAKEFFGMTSKWKSATEKSNEEMKKKGWRDTVNARKTVDELRAKAKFVDWNDGKRKEKYCVFAKSFKEKVKEPNVFLFDLERVFGKKQ